MSLDILTVDHFYKVETELIAILISEPQSIEEVEEFICPEYFYYPPYQKLVSRILAQAKKDIDGVNPVHLAPDFTECNVNVSELLNTFLTATKIQYLCKQLKVGYVWRQALQVANFINEKGLLRSQEEIEEALSTMESKLNTLVDYHLPRKEGTKDMVQACMELTDFFDDESPCKSLKTGLSELDTMTAGFKPGELIVIGARPSMGKTGISLTFLNSFCKANKKVLYFSFEMSTLDMMKRLISSICHIDLHKLNLKKENGKRNLNHKEYTSISEAFAVVADYQVTWHEQPCNVSQMRSISKKVKRQNGLDCIFVDHLGKVVPTNPNTSRYEQISDSIRWLKNLAKELDVPVIVLSQLSRKVEDRQNKRPMMSDLRESGEIEQESDLVMFLYRDEYYYSDTDNPGIMEILVEKHRNGPVGAVEVGFLKQYAKVVDLQLQKEGKERKIVSMMK